MKSTSGLDGKTCRRETGPLLLREKLHPQGRRSTKGHSQNVPRPPNSRTSQRTGNIQFYLTALLVARPKNLCQELCPRVQGMSTIQDQPTADKTLFSSNRGAFHHQTLCELLNGLCYRSSPGKRPRLHPCDS